MKKLFRNYILLFILLMSVINVNIFMPISDSGTLNVALAELLFPLIFLIIFFVIVFKKKPIEYKKIIITVGIFGIYYILLFALRYLNNMEYKQSLLTIKVSIFPIIILFLCKYLSIPKDKIIKCFVIFNFIINLLQLRYLTNLRMSLFLGNIVVYLACINALYIINLYSLFNKENGFLLRIISAFNVLINMFVPLIVGARSSFLLSVVITVFYLFYLLIRKNLKGFLCMVGLICIACVLDVSFWNYPGIATYNNRILPQIFKVETHQNNNEKPTQVEIPDFEIVTNIEKEKSDNIRLYLFNRSIEEIKKSPLLGTGLIYFDVDTDYGVSLQSAHNFVLEYLNAYGIIGCMLFLLIHLSVLSYFNIKNKEMLWVLIPSCLTVLIQSFVEPTFLIVPIVIIYYTLYALGLNWEVEDE